MNPKERKFRQWDDDDVEYLSDETQSLPDDEKTLVGQDNLADLISQVVNGQHINLHDEINNLPFDTFVNETVDPVGMEGMEDKEGGTREPLGNAHEGEKPDVERFFHRMRSDYVVMPVIGGQTRMERLGEIFGGTDKRNSEGEDRL